MLEVIETLKRVLERLSLGSGADADGKPVQQPRKGTLASLDSQRGCGKFGGSGADTLDKEFLESWIDALTRISLNKGVRVEDLPSWAITRSVLSVLTFVHCLNFSLHIDTKSI
jgi:hypothetical protein